MRNWKSKERDMARRNQNDARIQRRRQRRLDVEAKVAARRQRKETKARQRAEAAAAGQDVDATVGDESESESEEEVLGLDSDSETDLPDEEQHEGKLASVRQSLAALTRPLPAMLRLDREGRKLARSRRRAQALAQRDVRRNEVRRERAAREMREVREKLKKKRMDERLQRKQQLHEEKLRLRQLALDTERDAGAAQAPVLAPLVDMIESDSDMSIASTDEDVLPHQDGFYAIAQRSLYALTVPLPAHLRLDKEGRKIARDRLRVKRIAMREKRNRRRQKIKVLSLFLRSDNFLRITLLSGSTVSSP